MEFCLDQLFEDARFKPLFSEGAKNAVQLWIYQHKDRSCRLVYGWVVPYHYSNNSWNVPNEDKIKCIAGSEIQVICLSAYLEENHLRTFLASMFDGRSLKEASVEAAIKIDASVDSRFGHLMLDDSKVLKPVTYLPSRSQCVDRSIASPLYSFGVNSASIVSLEKQSFIRDQQQSLASIYSFIADQIKTDTGLDLLAKDAGRIGELEFLSFPGLDEYGRSKIKIEDKRLRTQVTLELSQYDDFDTIILKISYLNDNQIFQSNMYVENYDGSSEVCFDFAVNEYLDSLVDGRIVEIYGQWHGSVELSIIHESKDYFIREISSAMSISTISGTFESSWIRNYTRLSPNDPRVQKIESISKFSKRDMSLVSGRKFDLWVNGRRDMQAEVVRLFPKKSEGKFFPRHTDGEGRVEFVEWWKALFDKYASADFIIFDPYFEDVGLELIARHANGGSSVTVFTCNTNTGSNRVENIKAKFENLREVFGSVSLRVYTIPEIHDRYLLVSGENNIKKGFSLSNSIQAANADNPLLVTPIPADVLPDVNSYIDSVLSDESISNLEFCSQDYYERRRNNRRETLCSELHQVNERVSLDSVASFLDESSAQEVTASWNEIAIRLADLEQSELFESEKLFSEISLDKLLDFLKRRYEKADQAPPSATHLKLCSYLNAPVEALQNKLLGIDREGFISMIKWDSCSWGDYNAIKLLYKFHVEQFIHVLELWLNDYQLGNASREKSEFLLQCISEISTHCVFGGNNFPLVSLINSSNSLLKWIAVSYVEFRLIESNDTDSLNLILNELPKKEQVQWLGWLLNRSMKYNASPDWSEYAIGGMLNAMPSEPSVADIEYLVGSVKGRMQHIGYVSFWFPNKIIVPIIEQFPYSADKFLSIWLEGIIHQMDKLDSSYSLSAEDLYMTDVAVQLFSMASAEAQSKVLQTLAKYVKRVERDIRKPLAFIDGTKRDSSLKLVAWVYGFKNWLSFYTNDDMPCLASSLLSDLSIRVDDLLMYKPKAMWLSDRDDNDLWHRFFRDPTWQPDVS